VNYFADNSKFDFPLILSNKSDAFVHQRAEKLKIPSFTFTKDKFNEGTAILDILKKYHIDYIILAGFY